MIRIKVEAEEEEVSPLSNESENNQIKRLLSLKFSSKNNNSLNNFGGGSTTSDTNSGNGSGTLKEPENNVVVPMKVVPKKKKKKKPKQKLNNFTTDSVVAVGSKSIKTEPAESSLSLTTNSQLNQSLNFQNLLIPKEKSIPIGTQQQQQSLISTKIGQIVLENHQKEVPLSLDQSCSLILNLNPNSVETTTTTNCDTTIKKIFGPRACLCRRAKLNACYAVPKKPNQFTTTTIQNNSVDVGNLESTNNDDNYNYYSDQYSGSGSISVLDPSISFLTVTEVAAPSLPEAAAVPLLVGKKPLPLGIPPLTLSLEERRKARNREYRRLYYNSHKAIPKVQIPVDPEVRAEKLRRNREYNLKYQQRLLERGTPEQREQRRLKSVEKNRRRREMESEGQRKQRLEQARQYSRTMRKQRIMEPEEREKIRLKKLEYDKRRLEKETDEQRKRRLEQKRQYRRTVAKQRMELEMANNDTGREGKRRERESHLSGVLS